MGKKNQLDSEESIRNEMLEMRLQRCCICAQLSDGGGELHCQQRRTTADRPTDPIDDDDRSTDHHAEKSMSPPPLPSDDDEGRKWAMNRFIDGCDCTAASHFTSDSLLCKAGMNDKNTDQLDIHTLAGVVLAVVAPLGVAANAYVFVSVLRRRKTRSSFLTLCASKALFNLITCFVFLFWCTPTAFRGSYFLPPIVGLIFGDVIGGMVYLGGVITQTRKVFDMHFLLLLAGFLVYTTAQPTQNFNKIPNFPFLQGVSALGLQEFQKLFNTRDLTRSQWEANILRWAEKFNVKQSVLQFKQKVEKEKQAAEDELLEAMAKLMQFFKEYQDVGDNSKLTWSQADAKRQELVTKLTPKQQQAAAALSEIFAPVYDEQTQKQPEQYVPGPYGPRERQQYGVGEQAAYGESPYGERPRREAHRFERVDY
ncbi:hypothetical protein RB195_001465 [Necator americanus]|uniref:SXP/RAL-2 family protein Ani s 5-like cation-binding domain-containing protein n=1 Tax=Necator americanus TaxID=51031 RepID=A0ABR1DG02_NECAM